MARSIWTGSISFGLVNVPVKLYTAVSRKTVAFHQLHDADGARIQQRRVCSADGAEVAYENIVKGYEVAPGQYVVIETAELEALQPEKTKAIEIAQFVDHGEIDSIFYDQPYYLVAATAAAAKPYRLILDAMREQNKVAIGRVVLRQKGHLVAVRPHGDVLMMETLLFADEIVPTAALEEPAAGSTEISERELAMAQTLIDIMASPFNPNEYRDEYREAVLSLIERKIAGEEIAVAPEAPAPAAAPDLMAALEASLEAVGRHDKKWQGGAGPAKPKRRAKPAAPRATAKKS
jgi:DNA end-binding protein Ku